MLRCHYCFCWIFRNWSNVIVTCIRFCKQGIVTLMDFEQ